MRGPRWWVLVSCFFMSVCGASAVKAGGGGTIEGGTISFIGAVVAPTCSIAADEVSLSAVISTSSLHASLQRNCSRPTSTAESAPDPSRIYAVDVEHLSGSESDHVLNYFASYVRAAQPGSADPVLVTQSFE
jgi:hypothetical protein